jgi:hypothetical protein
MGRPKARVLVIFGGAMMIGTLVLLAVMMADPPAERTVYSKTSNPELKTRTSRLVKEIRELVYAHKRRDRQLLDSYEEKNQPEPRAPERKRLRDQWIKESDAEHDSFMRAYKDKYWAEAILLRRELHRRLGKAVKDSSAGGIYQHPTNLLGVEAIADNLELLAKSLPDG